ncbi:hypothetical protein [Bacteroides sp.]|uniref:hypothetical protein n=1 Tax=Bacteroides sp. TaxID=29523 RepID=UPI001B4C90A4|nr:hypothetical protein [Bacteroides sp.]MBP6065409.1 hypothetical protein [Bacteroides sp.]MBP6067512.1 hypothetical protein [Bacteroides sp.]MBP6937467.1 hypothetical protein [Bacteroides sp.]MBP8621852.1 hypothetical protein [Bacteroides sp.]MBP9586164.1 hypothetical protein [Bacteroides sp.]
MKQKFQGDETRLMIISLVGYPYCLVSNGTLVNPTNPRLEQGARRGLVGVSEWE